MAKIPPLKRLYTTGTLEQMAIAKLQGAINWSQLIFVNSTVGVDQGILLFDNQQAAFEYQHRKSGYPLVVCEFRVDDIDKDLLLRCEEFSPPTTFTESFRQWIYKDAIAFDRCWWHTYKQVEEKASLKDQFAAAGVKIVGITEINNSDKDKPKGIITLDI